MSEETTAVVDDAQHHRFLHVEDGHEAQLVYRVDGDRLILVHTEVPEALGGRGLGGQLVRAALARATKTGETIAPWCPYARKWLQDHPDEIGDVTIDWTDPPEETS
jgi:predicted GNAT family acetyltransferase